MNGHKSSAQLKAIAREKSLGRYGTLIGANLTIIAINLIISGFAGVSAGNSILLVIIGNLISVIINILLGVLVSGKAYLYMNLLYSQNVSVSDIFFGLKQQPQKAVIIQSVFVVADFLLTIPLTILMMQYMTGPDMRFIGAMFILIAVAIIVEVYIYLLYSQSFFILHDFPDRSAKEILSTSRHLMKGNMFRLLYLHISFIPLYLLGVITLFVPLLWVSAYREATVCAFYQDLIAGAANTKEDETWT